MSYIAQYLAEHPEVVESESAPRRTMTLRWRLVWAIAFLAPAITIGYLGDWPVAAMLVAACVGSFAGYRVGLVGILASLLALAAAVWFAPSLGIQYAPRFQAWMGTTGLTHRFLCIGIVGILISMVVTWLMGITLGRTVAKRNRLDRSNRCLGFVTGGLQGVAAVVCFIGGMLILEPIERSKADQRSPDDVTGQWASNVILKTAQSAKASRIGDALVRFNPVARIPGLDQLGQYHQTLSVIADPVARESMMAHPNLVQLKARPDVQKMVSEVDQDLKISERLAAGQSVDRDLVMQLISHPALMELVDQPGFLADAEEAFRTAAAESEATTAIGQNSAE